MGDIKDLQQRVDAGEVCPGLGSKADSICNQVCRHVKVPRNTRRFALGQSEKLNPDAL